MSTATLEARELGRGFAQAMPAAQQTFRAVLEAMSRPGRIQALPAEVLQGVEPPGLSPALTALLLPLLDAEVSLWLHPQLATRGAAAYLRFHTGVRLAEQAEDADFVVLPASAARPGTWLTINPGTDTRPESAGTLILDAQALSVEGPLRLHGPGIEHEHRLGVAGLTPAHEAPFWQARPRPETTKWAQTLGSSWNSGSGRFAAKVRYTPATELPTATCSTIWRGFRRRQDRTP